MSTRKPELGKKLVHRITTVEFFKSDGKRNLVIEGKEFKLECESISNDYCEHYRNHYHGTMTFDIGKYEVVVVCDMENRTEPVRCSPRVQDQMIKYHFDPMLTTLSVVRYYRTISDFLAK